MDFKGGISSRMGTRSLLCAGTSMRIVQQNVFFVGKMPVIRFFQVLLSALITGPKSRLSCWALGKVSVITRSGMAPEEKESSSWELSVFRHTQGSSDSLGRLFSPPLEIMSWRTDSVGWSVRKTFGAPCHRRLWMWRVYTASERTVLILERKINYYSLLDTEIFKKLLSCSSLSYRWHLMSSFVSEGAVS